MKPFQLIVPEQEITQVLSACQILGIEVTKNNKVMNMFGAEHNLDLRVNDLTTAYQLGVKIGEIKVNS